MTKVIPLHRPAPVPAVQTSALNPRAVDRAGQGAVIPRQAAIENALSMALYWVRHDGGASSLHAATVRAVRAASLLKQACADLATKGGAA